MRWILFVFLLIFTVSSNAYTQTKLQNMLDSIAAKWAPEKREKICDFKAEKRNFRVYISGETTEINAIKDLYNIMKLRKVRFSDGINLLPDTSTEKRCFGLVRVSVMNIRKTFSHTSELISQAVMGTPVRVLKNIEEHYLVQTPDNYIGWATHASLVLKTTAEMSVWKKEKRLMFTAKTGVIYADTLKSTPVSDIVMTSIVMAENSYAQWTKVILPDNRRGYIDSNLLTDFGEWAKNVQADVSDIVVLAKQFLGVSYLWGGTSVHALDCSGFVKTLYFMNGILLPRDASLQFKNGINVDFAHNFSDLEPGDLLFFGTKLSAQLCVTHVGMYIGNNEFIHESEWVRINSLNSKSFNYSEYYHRRLLSVKRFIKADTQMLRIFNNQLFF
ncbi:MAG: C40 family peptidase [Paludibacter sp.]|nr:C40 family peptidase [Paludibacter sp.]